MQLTQANLDSLFLSFKTFYNEGLGQVDTSYLEWCQPVPSSTAIEEYPIVVINGRMREWVGPRVFNQLDGYKMTVRNKDYEDSVEVDRNNIEDDRLGFYGPMFQNMGTTAANLWPTLAAEALTQAGTWADGTAFFSANRKLGKATINNVVNAALTADNYELARRQMMAFQDASKNPLKLVPNLLMVGPALEKTARKILEASLVVESGAAVDNIWKGTAKLLVNTDIAGNYANDWYLMCTTRGMKPVVVQKRKDGAVITRQDRDTDEGVFQERMFRYGVHARGAAVAGMPHLVIRGRA